MAILKNPAAACTPPSPHSRSRRSGVAANRRERATTNNQKSKNLKTGNMSSIVFGYRRNAGAKGTRSRFTVTQTTRVRRRRPCRLPAAAQRSPARPARMRNGDYSCTSTTAVPSGVWAVGSASAQRPAQEPGRSEDAAPSSSRADQHAAGEGARPRGLVSRVTVSVIGVGVSATHLVAHLYT